MRLLWTVTALAFIGSACTAFLAESFLTARVAFIGTVVGLQLSFNPGVAFGVHFAPVIQASAIGVALLLVIWTAVRTIHTRLQDTAFGLIIGGGLANIYDRLTDGVVTDFFQVGSFPIFNVADSCITVGVFLLLVEIAIVRRRGS